MERLVAQFRGGSSDHPSLDVVNWLLSKKLLASPHGLEVLSQQMAQLDESTPAPLSVIALCDGDSENEFVFIRGSHKNLGKEAPRGLLVALAGENQPSPSQGSGRLELAHRMTAHDNPVTGRVAVNRIWHHLFGRGIVPSVDDFGKMGQPPSHPALLDWLAHQFTQEHGWSIKSAIRQIVLSSTYRMSCDTAADPNLVASVDPDNVLLHRAPVRRLTAEALRDSMLQLSGRIDRTMFGPSVPQHLTTFMEGRGRPGKNGPLDGDGRRSIYLEVRRNFLSPMMLAFDRPSPFKRHGSAKCFERAGPIADADELPIRHSTSSRLG